MESLGTLFDRFGSDKNTWHSYGTFYDDLFPDRQANSILEIGVHSGASLRAWAAGFPSAQVYGIDVNPNAMLVGEERITTFCASVLDAGSLEVIGHERGPFELIVDDGSHRVVEMLHAWYSLEPFLSEGGVYVIEDISGELDLRLLLRAIPESRCVDLRSRKNQWDDLLLVVGR